MKHYSAERKESILRQMMAPTNKLVSVLAREHGISEQTFSTWRRTLKAQGLPVPGNGKNAEEWSSKDKFGVVLETAGLNEADLGEYCRRKGLFVEQITAWRQACQEANAHAAERTQEQREQGTGGGSCADHSQKKSPGDLGGCRGRLTGTPDRQLVKDLIEEAASNGCRLAPACAELEISLRTYQRWTREDDNGMKDGRRGAPRAAPANKLSEAERAYILALVNSAEFASQPPSQIVPTLVDRGDYVASESTMYRVMKAAAQQHHRGRAKKPSTRVVTSHCATEPNRLWSWDITWLPTAVKGLYFYWYMVLDVYSRKIVGHEVHVAESADLAALLMRRASLAEGLAGREVILHSDNGSAMKGATMLATLEKLGIMPSFSRPHVSNDNPFAESLFRTCKYRPNYPRHPFETVVQAQEWVQQFVQWYNHQHKHSGLKFVTPAQRHAGQADASLRRREQVYEAAKQRYPERWSGATRNWQLKDEVWLNPERADPALLKLAA